MKNLKKIILWGTINILLVIYLSLSGNTPAKFAAGARGANQGSEIHSPGFQAPNSFH